MTTRADALNASVPPDRLYYATGELLDAADFRAEQLYHRGRLARALAYLHGSGTVAGLRIPPVEPADAEAEERLLVEPGLAIDPLGRLIEVPRAQCIRLDRWYRAEPADRLRQARQSVTVAGNPVTGVVVDVYIRFVQCERGKTPSFAAGPFDALDAVSPSRLRDGFELSLLARIENPPPEPVSPWPDLLALAPEERAAAAREAVLEAWRGGTESLAPGEVPEPLAEHAQALGQDSGSVFLARLVLPADPAPEADARPVRILDAPVVVNELRPLVYPGGLLGRLLG